MFTLLFSFIFSIYLFFYILHMNVFNCSQMWLFEDIMSDNILLTFRDGTSVLTLSAQSPPDLSALKHLACRRLYIIARLFSR